MKIRRPNPLPRLSALHPRALLLAALLALLPALLLLVACGGGDAGPAGGPEADAAAAGPHRGGQIVIASSTDMVGVNEVISRSTVINSQIVRRMFLPLVDERADLQTLEPRLAESWEYSDDRKRLTFHLRDDVQWSDGTPVSAGDVAFTYRAWTDPDIAWEGAYALEEVERVEVVDPHTVVFHFTRPYSTQLLDVAAGAVVLPEHAWGALPFAEWRASADWFREHLVVNGPFRLASWQPQEEVVLERNPTYFEQGVPYLDRVILRVIPEQANQLTQLLAGQVDYVIQLSPDDVPRVESSDAARLLTHWGRGYIAVGWNTTRAPFDRVDVRRALTLGIDRQTLVDSIWGPYARVIASPVPPDLWAASPEVEPLPYDPREAGRLLAAAGWEDTDGDGVRERDGEPLTVQVITNSGNRQREDALVLMQEQLRRIGVAMEPQVLEFHSMVERAYERDFDGVLSGWTIPTTFDFRYTFHTSEIDGGNNFIGYSNPQVDTLLEEIRAAPTLSDAGPLLNELQAILQREQPYTFLWQSQRLIGVSQRLRDVRSNHLANLYELRYWWVTPEGGR